MNLKHIKANMVELELHKPIPGGLQIKIMFSYNTPVAMSDSVGLCYVTEKKWSRTTTKHINQWLAGRPAKKESQVFFDSLVGNYEVRA